MRINIDQLKTIRPGEVVVAFDSPLGKASARWVGSLPNEGMVCDVELDVPGVLVWGAQIIETTAPPSISEEAGRISLVGTIETMGDDGVAAVRLGSDVVLVETSGMPRVVPNKVLIQVQEIALFESGV